MAMNRIRWSLAATGGSVLFALGSFGGGDNKEETAKLSSAQVDAGVNPAELADLFTIGSKGTDIQRDMKEKEITGKTIEWKGLEVYEVSKSGACFRIQTSSKAGVFPGTFVKACPPEGGDEAMIVGLKTGDLITVKGKIDGISMRNVEIEPAVVSKGAGGGSAVESKPAAVAATNTSTAAASPGADCAAMTADRLAGAWVTGEGANRGTYALKADGTFEFTVSGKEPIRGKWNLEGGGVRWSYDPANGAWPPETNPFVECGAESFALREKDGSKTTFKKP
jgi:hypothetical protein